MSRLALIDGDILRYEVGFGSQFVDEESGELVVRPYEDMIELFDEKIRIIKEDTESDDVLIFLTNDPTINRNLNKKRARDGQELIPLVPNFRESIAKTKPYKGNRSHNKPFHYNNVTNYILEEYNSYVAFNGIEADDSMAIFQTKAMREGHETIICSRDKDLRTIPGYYYSWELGRQNSIGPLEISAKGTLELSEDNKEIWGTGTLFLYAQTITGDSVDNIPGLPRCGSVFAYKLLEGCKSKEDGLRRVLGAYREKIGTDFLEYFKEQINLLWIIRELDEEGNPVLFKIPDWVYEEFGEQEKQVNG